MNQVTQIAEYDDKVTILSKIFIWSLLFEPLKFFLLSSENIFGFSLSVSKFLQLLTFILLIISLLQSKKISIKHNYKLHYKYFCFYILIMILSSVIGLLSNSYETNKLTLNVATRPFFDFVITIYYFIYFVIFPIIFIKNKKTLKYFFKWLKIIFYLFVIIGLLDVCSNVIYKLDIIPRHLVDSYWVTVGFRFHSFAGEPRDAIVYLIFGIAIFNLYLFIYNNKVKNISIKFYLIIIFCIFLAQSVSGIIGILIGFGLIIYYGNILRIQNLFYIIMLASLVFLITFLLLNYSQRLNDYLLFFINLDNLLSSDELNNYYLLVQSPDIIPIWSYMNQLKEFEIIKILFGSGIGSASFETNNLLGIEGLVNNPRSQVARLVFETGLLGTFLYLAFLIFPLKYLINICKKTAYRHLFFSCLMLYGASLGHRSLLGFILLGLIMSIITHKLYEKN